MSVILPKADGFRQICTYQNLKTQYNDGLYEYLGDIGFQETTLNDRLRSFEEDGFSFEGLSEIPAILRKYSGSLYLPNDANCFQDSAGTTAGAKDAVVGLMIDQGQGGLAALGPELVTNGNFSNGTTGWTATNGSMIVSGGKAILNGSYGFYGGANLTAGKTYLVTFDISDSTAAGSMAIYATYSGLPFMSVPLTNGTKTFILKADDTGAAFGINATGITSGSLSIDNISVREVPGIHATQATTGYKPILRKGAVVGSVSNGIGPWWLDFDGSDDRLSLASVPFQIADDTFVASSVFISTISNQASIFSIGSSLSGTPVISDLKKVAGGGMGAAWRSDSSQMSEPLGGKFVVNTGTVATARKSGDVKTIRKNGAVVATNSTAVGATTVNKATIGGLDRPSFAFPWTGGIYALALGKGTITDSELLTIERYLASLAGVTI